MTYLMNQINASLRSKARRPLVKATMECESLEGRQLLSHVSHAVVARAMTEVGEHAARTAHVARLGHHGTTATTTSTTAATTTTSSATTAATPAASDAATTATPATTTAATTTTTSTPTTGGQGGSGGSVLGSLGLGNLLGGGGMNCAGRVELRRVADGRPVAVRVRRRLRRRVPGREGHGLRP